MKPVYLEFCGINSFSEKAQIDFRKLLDGGLFGIFGDTGSGKSTILDCIHFALYGKIERSSGTDSINYKCDKAYVVYDFEITCEGKRRVYRVQRERRRKNNVAKAWLYEYDGEEKLQGVAEGVLEVDKRVEEIIGLGFDDFKKCIALPQGEFAGLVKAKPSERLQLVSRLFDLEKYGEKLSAGIRLRCERSAGDAALIQAKMQENAEGTPERIEAESEKLRIAFEKKSRTEAALSETETRLTAAQKLAEEKREYEKLCLEKQRAEARLAYYAERRRKLDVFPAAAAVREKSETLEKCVRAKDLAIAATEKAEMSLKGAQRDLEVKRRQLEESGLESEIQDLAVVLGKLQAAEEDIAACREAEARLKECTEKYRAIKNKVSEEDFDALAAANDGALTALGESESFTEFLKHHFKDVLLTESYGEFREDLKGLESKYPETETDVETLVLKYTLAAGGERSFDVAAAQLEFKRIEERRRELKAQREALEKRKKAYEENEREKARIVEDGKHYRERAELARQKIAFAKDLGTPEEVTRHIETLRGAKKRSEDNIRSYEEKVSALSAEREKQKAFAETHALREKETREEIETLLKENGLENVTAARSLALEIGDGKRAKEECDAFFDEYNVVGRKLAEIPAEKFDGFSAESLVLLESEKRRLSLEKDSLLREIAVGEKEIERLGALQEKYRELEKEYKAKLRERELWEKLKNLTARGKFMEFIASEYLQDICISASKTLLSLTGGRYFLKYGDEFKAGDNLNGGALRSVKTLSGGETFLVSLSLALALSGAICAKSLRPIEFFFLDEGFGTLDEKLVDTVMDVLEKLRSKHFSIGLISHVEEMKHRIDNKILVTGATDRCGSSVRVEAY
ncbi:MAG: SMC family ATPase [Firmicutes bacterium]|nr:SMC family ATPase [Bacillota bacterium]